MPTTWDLVGNDSAIERLQRASKAPRHAYLFTGPPRIGKNAAARRFAAALICGLDKAPCGNCQNCKLLEAGHHPDFYEAPEGKTVPIEDVRKLKQKFGMKPHSASFRVAIIHDAERLSLPAQNALLKLLEEPPPQTVMILTATSPATLLPTTVSRCHQIRFSTPPISDVVGGLKKLGVADSTAKQAASLADRRPGLALELSREADQLDTRQEQRSKLSEALDASIPGKLKLAKELSIEEDLPEILDSWQQAVRESLTSPESGESKLVKGLREKADAETRGRWLKSIFEARRRLRYNPNVQLLVEQLLLRLGD